MFSEENHIPKQAKPYFARTIKTPVGKQPLGFFRLCIYSVREQLAPGSQSSGSGWTLLENTHSMCGHTSHALGVTTQGFSKVQTAHCKHPHQLIAQYPPRTEKLKTVYERTRGYTMTKLVRNICFLEWNLVHSHSIHTGL